MINRDKFALLMALTLLLCACGGGGGSKFKAPTLSISKGAVTVKSEQGLKQQPQIVIPGRVSNAEDAYLYWDVEFDQTLVSSVNLVTTSDSDFNLIITLQEPKFDVGSYSTDVVLGFCEQSQCPTNISGSPQTVKITYEIEEATYPSFSLESDQIEVRSSRYDAVGPDASVAMQTRFVSSNSGAYFKLEDNSGVVSGYSFSETKADPLAGYLLISFDSLSYYGEGTYDYELYVSLCLDSGCGQVSQDSPKVIKVRYTVTEQPNHPDLQVSSSKTLSFDVIDAEYSDSLDAVIFVSSYPASRLYRYDVKKDVLSYIDLSLSPSAVSVSPSGLTAAVGHNGHISYIELNRLRSADYVPTVLDVSTNVLDVVLADNGYVYAFPVSDQWAYIRAVEIATNTEVTSNGYSIYAGTLARLHPSGKYIYGADNGISPSDIEKYDIQDGTPNYLYDSPYHGDYGMCGNLWFSESGLRIYTRCGNVFKASETRAQDMVYTGALELSEGYYSGYVIGSLDDSTNVSEIVAIEEQGYNCSYSVPDNNCYWTLRTYESAYLQPKTTYLLPDLQVAGNSYRQRGRFVFYTSDGHTKVLVSQALTMPNPDTEYFLQLIHD